MACVLKDMKAPTATLAVLLAASSGLLSAADPQLLNLVMPDAKVIAGVNVDQAKASPFGMYVLSQLATQDQEMQKLTALTGFDPRRDVHEVLVASDGDAQSHSGIAVARGTFDVAAITAFATAHQSVAETYNKVTILEDPRQTHGIAFLNSTLVVAGDVANVKAAIDRQNGGSVLPAALAVQVNQWSGSQDAWAISTVPPSTLHPAHGAPKLPGVGQAAGNAFQSIQQAAGGVKFGSSVTLTAQAQADTERNASGIVDALKLLAGLAQMQASNDPQATALLQSLTVSAQGNSVNVGLSVPEDQFQQLVQPHPRNAAPRRGERGQ